MGSSTSRLALSLAASSISQWLLICILRPLPSLLALSLSLLRSCAPPCTCTRRWTRSTPPRPPRCPSRITKQGHDNGWEGFGGLENATLKQLDLGSYPVATIEAGKPAALAFAKMKREKVSCLAIVSQPGLRLIGEVSAEDARSFTRDNLPKLIYPVEDFVKIIAPERHDGSKKLTMHSTLKTVLLAFKKQNAHDQMFVCDDEGRPVRVITRTDVCDRLIAEDAKLSAGWEGFSARASSEE